MNPRILSTCLAFLIVMPYSSSSSSSSAAEPATPTPVEFLDPTEKFQSPPPTQIALGELLAEADFVAVVYSIDAFGIPDCNAEVLRLKRLCARREDWRTPGMLAPHRLRNAEGDDFLLAVSRRPADIFTHGANFDNDAYDVPIIRIGVPYLYFGKVRPVTAEQAEALQAHGPASAADGDRSIPLGFATITPQTPVRAVQGLRGIYPLHSLARLVAMETQSGHSDTPEQDLRGYDFKYLIQTYTEPDATPLVKGVNHLLEALSKEQPQARQSLGALTEDADPVTAAAAKYLLLQAKLPHFELGLPVPLPAGD